MTQHKQDWNIINGDALSTLTDNFTQPTFQTCVTSPPYWGLRDYGIETQIGSETDINEYINKLVNVFRAVRNCLKDDGTLWLNIGDSYTSGGRTWRDADKKNPARGMSYRAPTPEGLKPKDLIGVPWRLAFALQADGWYLRSDIIWYKPNCQPESVRDRPTQSHEYLFLLTKSEKYLYNSEAIKEDTKDKKGKRNARTVWEVNTEPYKEAHFAVFPSKLVKPCILAGSNPGDYILDPFAGSGTVGEVSMALNRKFVGIELNSDYVDLAKRRIIKSIPSIIYFERPQIQAEPV
ncbi:site-specific DNA-methyltransferase [Spirosoma sp. KCTC 42546]|uniref:DNA-methyltransferase n=1 Tax=Spirosoma sp. KCTC 42546 TaxID=2520506 RepID=UPI001AEF51BD|nr:site-specific DNA-methyltransferase [Spirosoma sp. KCTC 42546]